MMGRAALFSERGWHGDNGFTIVGGGVARRMMDRVVHHGKVHLGRSSKAGVVPIVGQWPCFSGSACYFGEREFAYAPRDLLSSSSYCRNAVIIAFVMTGFHSNGIDWWESALMMIRENKDGVRSRPTYVNGGDSYLVASCHGRADESGGERTTPPADELVTDYLPKGFPPRQRSRSGHGAPPERNKP